ncbi:unnamed protein product [Phytophthora lilii]|uniref:Unnamed protein product n=1 Tax=Phytophthora lilii TaxID=2077276 RepID=A0A9W6U052_9STRA|nr:unnamed protein product [Phytophthora lilii]
MYSSSSSLSDGSLDDVKSEVQARSATPVSIKTEPATPEPCEEKPPACAPPKLSPPPESKEGVQLSADQLKKHRRNERDRRRSFAKRVRAGAGVGAADGWCPQ